MKTYDKPKVGDEFYMVNSLRRSTQEGKHATVEKVGRLYFYVSVNYSRELIKFEIQTRRHGGDFITYCLFEDKQAYADSLEAEKWGRKLYDAFSAPGLRSNYTLAQYKEVGRILGVEL